MDLLRFRQQRMMSRSNAIPRQQQQQANAAPNGAEPECPLTPTLLSMSRCPKSPLTPAPLPKGGGKRRAAFEGSWSHFTRICETGLPRKRETPSALFVRFKVRFHAPSRKEALHGCFEFFGYQSPAANPAIGPKKFKAFPATRHRRRRVGLRGFSAWVLGQNCRGSRLWPVHGVEAVAWGRRGQERVRACFKMRPVRAPGRQEPGVGGSLWAACPYAPPVGIFQTGSESFSILEARAGTCHLRRVNTCATLAVSSFTLARRPLAAV
jgi:hypothetical protein